MKPNRNMIAPCPVFPHDVGAFDCGSAAFPIFPVFFFFFFLLFLPFSGLAHGHRCVFSLMCISTSSRARAVQFVIIVTRACTSLPRRRYKIRTGTVLRV